MSMLKFVPAIHYCGICVVPLQTAGGYLNSLSQRCKLHCNNMSTEQHVISTLEPRICTWPTAWVTTTLPTLVGTTSYIQCLQSPSAVEKEVWSEEQCKLHQVLLDQNLTLLTLNAFLAWFLLSCFSDNSTICLVLTLGPFLDSTWLSNLSLNLNVQGDFWA
jgi:hypothetical protein